MMNQSYGNNKSQNLRFIIVTALVGLVILGIAIWAITFVIGNFDKKQVGTADTNTASSTSVSVTSDPSAMPSATADPSETPTSTAEPTTPTVESAPITTPPAVTVAPTPATVPQTGPEEILPLALVLGAGVAYVASRRMAFANR